VRQIRVASAAASMASAILTNADDDIGKRGLTALLDWPVPWLGLAQAVAGLSGDAAFPFLEKAIKYPDATIRIAAAEAMLRELRAGREAARAPLLALLKDEEPQVRELLFYNTDAFPEGEAAKAARKALSDLSPLVRLAAATAILAPKSATQPASQP
jgi:hypothetical protein